MVISDKLVIENIDDSDKVEEEEIEIEKVKKIKSKKIKKIEKEIIKHSDNISIVIDK